MNENPPPSAPMAEKLLLSIMLQEPEKWIPRIIGDGVTSDHFWIHKEAWSLITKRHSDGKSLDAVHVFEEEKSNDRLIAIGGMAGFVEIMNFSAGVPGMHYAADMRLLRDAAVKRTAYFAANELQAISDASEASEAMETAEKLLETLQGLLTAPQGMISADEAGTEFYRRLIENYENGDIPGHSTGIHCIDEASGGLRKNEFWVIGAETSGGKSVLMLQLLRAVLDAGHRGLLFTLELTAPEIIGRLAAIHGRIPYEQITKPRTMTKHTMGRMKGVVDEMRMWPLMIQDSGAQSISEIVSDCLRYRDVHGQIGIVVVDYLQMVEFDAGEKKGMNREQELGAISRRLKALAKDLKCPVVTAVQLNDDGKIRESRSSAFDADNVLFIGDHGIIAKKMRNAVRGAVLPLFLDGQFQRFVER